MPEAAIHEDGHPSGLGAEIGSTSHAPKVSPITTSECPYSSSEADLDWCVEVLNGTHPSRSVHRYEGHSGPRHARCTESSNDP